VCLLVNACFFLPAWSADLPPNPEPEKRQSEKADRRFAVPVFQEKIGDYDFTDGADGWVTASDCRIFLKEGQMIIEPVDGPPIVFRKIDSPSGQINLKMRLRTETPSDCMIYWITRQSPRRGEDKSFRLSLHPDGKWHDYDVRLSVNGFLTAIVLKLESSRGTWDFEEISVHRKSSHPLTLKNVERRGEEYVYTIFNAGTVPVKFTCREKKYELEPKKSVEIASKIHRTGALEIVSLTLLPEKIPKVSYPICNLVPDAEIQWHSRKLGNYVLELSQDGRAARVMKDDQMVGLFAPIMHQEGELPAFQVTETETGFDLKADSARVTIETSDQEIAFAIESDVPCEGPIVRAQGKMMAGLLSGLEFLGPGERSSSEIDVEGSDHLRFMPPPELITLPLMAFCTDRASLALTWQDMQLQPTFSSPNSMDLAEDHRMSLKGEKIRATVLVGEAPLEEMIHGAVTRRGLPKIPAPPRSPGEQAELCLEALTGPLQGEDGGTWGYCVNPQWPRKPYADMLSTIWRLTGERPRVVEIVPGGSPIANESIYFIADKIFEWKDFQFNQCHQTLAQMRDDGSYHYQTRFEDYDSRTTSNGYCARKILDLMEYIHITGDARIFQEVAKTLDFLKTTHVPRGGHFWETPLHTPDLLAAAHLTQCFTRAYQFTQEEEYLKEARRWALFGLPFVYQWGNHPIMVYTTPPMYGATERNTPVWFGHPQPWTGLCYAYALTTLAPHDDSLDWNHVARGILVAAQQMQYPSGPYAGCLPDGFMIELQERRYWKMNPCAIVSVARAVEGEVDSLSVAADDRDRIAAPFAAQLVPEGALLRGAPEGLLYQVFLNGQRIVDVQGTGKIDRVVIE
jgi:hypothetical protein